MGKKNTQANATNNVVAPAEKAAPSQKRTSNYVLSLIEEDSLRTTSLKLVAILDKAYHATLADKLSLTMEESPDGTVTTVTIKVPGSNGSWDSAAISEDRMGARIRAMLRFIRGELDARRLSRPPMQADRRGGARKQ